MAFCKRNDWLILPCAKIGGILAAQPKPEVSAQSSHQAFLRQFVAAAIERTHHVVRYDPAYVRIAYPGGDVPSTTGVCTDEVIRAYRAVGIDLQKEVHEDMAVNFGLSQQVALATEGPGLQHRPQAGSQPDGFLQ